MIKCAPPSSRLCKGIELLTTRAQRWLGEQIDTERGGPMNRMSPMTSHSDKERAALSMVPQQPNAIQVLSLRAG